ncbi:MAG: flagellar biosynthetic protein FliQ [Lachnospiraceae bacterium]|uniref:Flagellar biosynthetic protein FliQ n=1 Tax=Candidatus Weimeria bifida TaxID=2599074 RepID=A0A6N7J1C6_9FIRM|nr:flagellar biosynthesis protein FliQ [Candidatus Weimeria bifida]RRF96322.1 MAG: flagellar biosynthetic protein FliQ [Lachnospiraceae bacterium]
MTEAQVLDIMRDAFYNVIVCSAPMLLISLVVGLIISIFQTVTSIQEQTLTFVPKIISIFIALLIFGSFIMRTLVTFITNLWSNFNVYIK